jgi:hypothetical protein
MWLRIGKSGCCFENSNEDAVSIRWEIIVG